MTDTEERVMSGYIDADATELAVVKATTYGDALQAVREQPSIDIVRCKECKHGEYREDFDDYECHSSGCGLVYDANFFCADGERESE